MAGWASVWASSPDYHRSFEAMWSPIWGDKMREIRALCCALANRSGPWHGRYSQARSAKLPEKSEKRKKRMEKKAAARRWCSMTTQEYHGTTERERGKQIKNALRQPGRAKCVSGTMAYSVAALVSGPPHFRIGSYLACWPTPSLRYAAAGYLGNGVFHWGSISEWEAQSGGEKAHLPVFRLIHAMLFMEIHEEIKCRETLLRIVVYFAFILVSWSLSQICDLIFLPTGQIWTPILRMASLWYSPRTFIRRYTIYIAFHRIWMDAIFQVFGVGIFFGCTHVHGDIHSLMTVDYF